MLDKEKCFESVVYAPKYNKINLVVPQKTLESIFNTAWNMFHRYSYDEAVGYLDVTLYDQANEYNLQCTYDKLINMYLKLHPKENKIMNTNIFKVERKNETTGETWTEILMLDKIYSIREARFGESATRTGVRKGYNVYSIGGTHESAVWIDDETYKILVKKLENM